MQTFFATSIVSQPLPPEKNSSLSAVLAIMIAICNSAIVKGSPGNGFCTEMRNNVWISICVSGKTLCETEPGLRTETGISAHRDFPPRLVALSTPLSMVCLSGCQTEDAFKFTWQPELVVMSSSATHGSSLSLSALSAATSMLRLQKWRLLYQHSEQRRMQAFNNNKIFI